MRQVCLTLVAGFVVVVSLSSALVDPVQGERKSARDLEIEEIDAKLRNKAGFFGRRKWPDMSSEETLEQLQKLRDLSAGDAKHFVLHSNAKQLIEASQISDDKCDHMHLSNHWAIVKMFELESRNLETYLKDCLRKQLAACAGPLEEAARKIDEPTGRELKALNETIRQVEERDLGSGGRNPTRVNFDVMGKAAYEYLVSRGYYSPDPDPSENYYAQQYTVTLGSLCNMDKFEPRIRTHMFRQFLGTDLLADLSQEIQDFIEHYKNCYDEASAYPRSDNYRRCLLAGGQPEFC